MTITLAISLQSLKLGLIEYLDPNPITPLSTMILNLPADVYPSHSVASVSGMSGTGAGIGTIVATYLIGRVADSSSFEPVLLVAGGAPLLAVAAILVLVRNDGATARGLVNRI